MQPLAHGLALRFAALAAATCTCLALGTGCGTDVDIGGSTSSRAEDAGADATAHASTCEPCASEQSCGEGASCVQFAGDTFCAISCAPGSACAGAGSASSGAEQCSAVTSSTGARVTACLPLAGACAVPEGPHVGDAAVNRCGAITGPTIPSECHACGRFSNDCQPNGCYGGYWCNTKDRECQRPPKTCP